MKIELSYKDRRKNIIIEKYPDRKQSSISYELDNKHYILGYLKNDDSRKYIEEFFELLNDIFSSK